MDIVLQLDKNAARALKDIRTLTHMSDSKAFGYSLSLLLWALNQEMQQRLVGSIDERNQTYRALDLYLLAEEPTKKIA
jgi:hypothetical protein